MLAVGSKFAHRADENTDSAGSQAASAVDQSRQSRPPGPGGMRVNTWSELRIVERGASLGCADVVFDDHGDHLVGALVEKRGDLGRTVEAEAARVVGGSIAQQPGTGEAP